MKSENTFNARQLQAIPLLVCNSIAETARQLEMSEAQIYTWLQNPNFKVEIEQRRNDILESSISRLKGMVTKAVDVFVDLLGSQSESIRLKAANDIFNHVTKFVELRELTQRLDKLEDAVK